MNTDVDLEALKAQVIGSHIGVLEALVEGLRTKDPTETHTIGEFTAFIEGCIEDVKALHPEATR